MSPIDVIGYDLKDALTKALIVDNDNQQKNQRLVEPPECVNLRFQIGSIDRDMTSLNREIAGLKREISNLEFNRDLALGAATISLIVSASGALSTAIKGTMKFKKLKQVYLGKAKLTALDILKFVPIVGGLAAAALSLHSAATSHSQLKPLADEAKSLEQQASDLKSQLSTIVTRSKSMNCAIIQ